MSIKKKWIAQETWAEVIERFDTLCETREEAIAAWETCYGRPISHWATIEMVSDGTREDYWSAGKHYSGYYCYMEL